MQTSSKAFAFSADPITLGHEKIIETASEWDANFKIIVAANKDKLGRRTFSIPEAVKMVRDSIGNTIAPENIYSVNGSLARHFLRDGIDTLYRGRRNVVDDAYEAALEFFYKSEHPELQIIRLTSDSWVQEVSSSAVKETLALGHSIAKFVRPAVKASLESRIMGQYPIGVTGLSGAGKSNFSQKMMEIGRKCGIEIHHIDYDTLAHEIYDSSYSPEVIYARTRKQIGETFPGVQKDDGSIDRVVLRKYVFDGKDASTQRAKLDAIMRVPMQFRYSDTISDKKGVLLVDAALLAQGELMHLTNYSQVLVTAEDSLRAKRILRRSHATGRTLSEEQVQSQMSTQCSQEKLKEILSNRVVSEWYGGTLEFNNTEPQEEDFERMFWNMIAKLDVFWEIRGKWVLEKLQISEQEAKNILNQLHTRYDESGRYYHTWSHVVEIFDSIFDSRFGLGEEEKVILSLAAMWHDLVYDTDISVAKHNEIRSFDEFEKIVFPFREKCAQSGTYAWVQKAREIALGLSESPLADVFHDFDYSILASNPRRYRAYQSDIQREWTKTLPLRDFISGRSAFLQKINANNTSIFRTPVFQETLEKVARHNIQTELSQYR